MRNVFKSIFDIFGNQINNLILFRNFFFFYLKKKILRSLLWFEKHKNILVKFLLMKRGRYNRPFLHIVTMVVIVIGVLLGPFITDTYPIFLVRSNAISQLPSPSSEDKSIVADQNVFQTNISPKPRDQIIDYTVEGGDTISTIAQKFGISSDTIRWENNLTNDNLSVGDTLKILPVTGVSYKVKSGDTVYTIAKQFNTNPQKIVDFPFNDFANPETFSLVAGEILIVPDGIKPSEQPAIQQYYAQVPTVPSQGNVIPSPGGFIWPILGEITQYFTWYHTGLDIAGPAGTPISAAKSGTVIESSCGWNYGYGCHVLLDNGGGFSTMYAHMISQPIVSIGQSVSQGQVIGYRGSTGRSTGNHTHFEIRINGHVVNPLSYLK